MSSIPEQKGWLKLKVVHLLDCVAGRAARPDGDPIIIMSLACNDEIESPMMLSKYDAQRLVVRLMVALDAHGDELAHGLLESHFTAEPDPNDVFRKEPSETDPNPLISGAGRRVAYPRKYLKYIPVDPPPELGMSEQCLKQVPPPPRSPLPRDKPWRKRLTSRTASICKCTVQYGPSYRPRNSFFVLGGYTDGASIYILGRRRSSGGGAEDGIARILPNGQVNLWGDGSADWLPDEDWERFLALRKGKTFPLNGKQWTKMTVDTLAALVHGRVFKSIQKP